MKRALSLASLLLALSFAGAVTAQENPSGAPSETAPTRIVLVTGAGLDELGNRFAAELASLHFEVVRAADTAEPQAPGALEALALVQHARAAVRVLAAEGAIDLWLVNPATHEAVYRRIVSEPDPAVAVLRSLEILRGSLIDLRALAPKPKPPAAPAPKPAPHRSASPTTYVGLHAAATSLDARSAPAAGALATVQVAVTPKLWLNAQALVPVSEWQVGGAGGRVKAWALGLALGGSVAPWGEGTFTPTVGLGLGLLALHTRGEADAGFRGTSDLNLAAFPHAQLAAALKLSPRLRLRTQTSSGFAVPRPVLLFADERNTGWINPVVLGALGLELAWN